MGKYKCKHTWGLCKYKYNNSVRKRGIKAGDLCHARCAASFDGSFLCSYHKPKRIQGLAELHRRRAIKKIKEQYEKFTSQMKSLGLLKEADVVENMHKTYPEITLNEHR